MKINKEGLELIKKYEGCRLTAYKDAVGIPTIGYGHISGVSMGMHITQAEADKMLENDIHRFEMYVDELKLNLNINQYSALVSFAFNVGYKNLHQLCDGRTIKQIADHIQLYNKAGGKVLQGLVNRRKAEYNLFMKPVSSLNQSETTGTVSKVNEEELNNALKVIAKAVINDYFGSGEKRKENIYKSVQNEVNKILKGR